MRILGLHTGAKAETEFNRTEYGRHDSAAVLLEDGEVVAAIEEERLSRVKHCNFFPSRAIDFCLRQGRIGLDDVDFVAVNDSMVSVQTKALLTAFNDTKQKVMSGDELLSLPFKRFSEKSISDRLIYCDHHLAHAWSAFPLSGFDESLVMVLDGDGPGSDGQMLAGLIGLASRNNFQVIREIDVDNSLGIYFQSAIKFIGYDRFDEYKVMGLAPYGNASKFRGLFRTLYNLAPNGTYTISKDSGKQLWQGLLKLKLFKSFRRSGEPIEQEHKDFAAALQESLEEIVLHTLRAARKEFRKDYLCLAGGVAHNCTLNGKIRNSGLFKDIFIQPAAHDAGGALGAAFYAQSLKGGKPVKKLKHVYYGTGIPENAHISNELSKWKPAVRFEESQHVCLDTAKLLANNEAVIGWVQGRSEFGPRALGNRSILADPRPAKNKERINKMIKKREAYRPFAPSVLAERVPEFFETDKDSGSLFMNVITSVKPEKREILGATTHVDGTARIQVVQQEANPKYWDLIYEFNKLTGVPILLNTSFNNNVEPIVDSVADALVCFLTTDLTHLVVGDFIIYKNKPVRNCLSMFRIGIRESYKVVSGFKTVPGGFSEIYSIEFNASELFAHVSTEISKNLFQIISQSQGQKISDIAARLKISLNDKLIDEIFTLWNKRVIWLDPIGTT